MVAAKILRSVGSIEDRQRFLRETTALKRLSHPTLIRHIDSGFDDGWGQFVVTEWVEGRDLEEFLRADGRPSLEVGLDIARQLASGMAHVHARGMLHRDLKPANVRVSEPPVRVKILDFGLARQFGAGAETAVTGHGQFLGTPRYVSPEQARGELHIDPRADVFSLGGVFYRCFSGKPAFDAPTLRELLHNICSEPHQPLASLVELPTRLGDLVDSMLEKDSSRRPPHAQAVLDVLDELSVSGRPHGPTVASFAWGRPFSARTGLRIIIDTRDAGPTVSRLALEHLAASMDLTVDAGSDGVFVIEARADVEVVDAARRISTCTTELRRSWPRSKIVVTSKAREEVTFGPALAPGSVSVDPSLSRLVQVSIELNAPKTLVSGGRGALDNSPDGALRTPTLRLLTELVSRDDELRRLHTFVDQSFLERSSGLITVRGAAGIGKSRLMRALVASYASSKTFTCVCVGTMASRHAVLRSLAEGMRGALGGASVSRVKQSARLGELLADSSTPSRWLATLTELLWAGGAHGSGLHDETLSWDVHRRALEELVRSVVRSRPVLLVLDELEHVDAPTVALVRHLLRALHDAPLAVVAFGRDLAALAPVDEDERRSDLELGPLELASTRSLVRTLLGSDSEPAQVDRIATLSGGNPRVVEELAFLAGGDLSAESGLFLRRWFEVCFDSLRAQERGVLRAAALFGERFPVKGVRRLLRGAISPEDVDGALGRLEQVGLFRLTSSDGFSDGDRNVFAQPLLPRIVEASLSDEERRSGHGVAGEWLALNAGDDPAAIAHHFDQAADRNAAAIWYLRAARHALQGEDMTGASAFVDAGLRVAEDPDAVGRLWLVRAEVMTWRGDPPAAATAAREALKKLERSSLAWVHALSLAASASLRLGDAQAHRSLALEAAELVTDQFVAAPSLRYLLRLAIETCDGGGAGSIELLHRRLNALVRGHDTDDVRALGLVLRGVLARRRGEYDVAVDDLTHAVRLFDSLDDLRSATTTRLRLVDFYHYVGQHELGAALLAELIPTATLYDWRSILPEVRLAEARAKLAAGAPDAVDALHGAARVAGTRSDMRLESRARAMLAGALASVGRLTEAETEARRSLDLASRTPDTLAFALTQLAAILCDKGAHAPALRMVELALKTIEGSDLREIEEQARLVQARALMKQSRLDDARAAARRGVELLEQTAETISDTSLRERYLTVPARTGLLALARELEE